MIKLIAQLAENFNQKGLTLYVQSAGERLENDLR